MNCKKTISWLGLAVMLPILGACSSNETKPEDALQTSEATTTGNKAAVAGAVTAAKPAVEVKNPTVVSFEKMAVTLDDKAREQIGQTLERARQARKIVITGYCDKRQVGNPTEAAVARAVVARDELVRLGISPGIIHIKFVTTVAKKHAAEIKFD